jgi:hypothetical protein
MFRNVSHVKWMALEVKSVYSQYNVLQWLNRNVCKTIVVEHHSSLLCSGT